MRSETPADAWLRYSQSSVDPRSELMENDQLAGTPRVALVTGGMGGLGEAICQALAKAGLRVVATFSPGNDHSQKWLAAQRSSGYSFAAYQIDVSDFSACASGVTQIVAEIGPIDILINNAGITRDVSLRKMTVDDWQAVVHTNLDSVFNMTKQVVSSMVDRQWGRIVNISSVNGQRGSFGQTNYSAAKAGIHGFTKSLALEVAKKGITVNTVSPGFLRTPMVTKMPAEILNTKILPDIPIGRLGEPDEVAGLVTYLVSERASFVTGANIAINGGQHMF
jgi:acetoacetyl-CoA reductase